MTDPNDITNDITTFAEVFKQWLSQPDQAVRLGWVAQLTTDEPALKAMSELLERAFMAGASVGVQAQAHADESQLAAALAQRDFLDIACSKSQDDNTRHWRRGFEKGCPPELEWNSKSGGESQ